MDKSQLIEEAIEALRDFEVGREQLNERSAMTLLALLQLKPGDDWARATNPMLGTRAIMDWIRDQYGVEYAANTRETIRLHTAPVRHRATGRGERRPTGPTHQLPEMELPRDRRSLGSASSLSRTEI